MVEMYRFFMGWHRSVHDKDIKQPLLSWLRMSRLTLSVDLLTWKFCMAYRQLMGCIGVKHEVNILYILCDPDRWRFDLEMMGGKSPLLKRTSQINMELWCGHHKNFKWPVRLWLLTSKWCTTHHTLMGCIWTKYEANLSNRHKATKGTHKKWTIGMTLTFYFWPENGTRYIVPSQVVFLIHVKWIGQIEMERV